MSTVAKIVIRTTCGLMVLAAAADCGSAGEAGPYGGEPGGNLGFVGSGGRGVGYGHDAGTGIADGGVDGGSARADGGDGGKSSDGGNGNGMGGDAGGEDAGGNLDGGSGASGIFNLPPGFFPSLDWVISGPSGSRSGTVMFGNAQSIEFVAGGIPAGSGYTLAIAGVDIYGDPCNGTSAPFEVLAGQVASVGIVLACTAPLTDAAGPANVTTGSVEVDAGVIFRDF